MIYTYLHLYLYIARRYFMQTLWLSVSRCWCVCMQTAHQSSAPVVRSVLTANENTKPREPCSTKYGYPYNFLLSRFPRVPCLRFCLLSLLLCTRAAHYNNVRIISIQLYASAFRDFYFFFDHDFHLLSHRCSSSSSSRARGPKTAAAQKEQLTYN